MVAQELLARISVDPALFNGKPTLRGRPVSVERVLSLLAQQKSQETILAAHPELEPDDIRACLAYALVIAPR